MINERRQFEAPSISRARNRAGVLQLPPSRQKPPTDVHHRSSLLNLPGSLENAVDG